MSVRQAQEEISSPEFSEWRAYDELDPFGEGRADLRAGIIAATMANLWSSGKQKVPYDFMPDFDKTEAESEQQSVEDMQARLMILAGGLTNGKPGGSICKSHGDNSKI